MVGPPIRFLVSFDARTLAPWTPPANEAQLASHLKSLPTLGAFKTKLGLLQQLLMLVSGGERCSESPLLAWNRFRPQFKLLF